MEISPPRRNSSNARKATACSIRDSSPTSWSKSNRERLCKTERNRSRNCTTGGKRSAMCASDTSGGGTASSRITAASRAGSCGASVGSTLGARGAGPTRKYRSPSASSRSRSQPAASFMRRYSASRRASSSAACSGSSSASSAASSGNNPRAFSSSSAEMRTRNSPQASRSSCSRSASRSRNARTIAAMSNSARSSSSLRTSVSSRSKGPSKASRSSSSSRTITGWTLSALPDATSGDGHGRPLRDRTSLLDLRPLLGRGAQELPPHEERDRDDEAGERHPEVEPLAGEMAGRVDPERLLVRAERGVEGHVQREQRRPPQREAPVDPEQREHREHVPRELVQERRVELVRGALAVDLERPRQRRVLAVQLLVPVVAPAPDALCEQEAGRDRVHEQADAVPGAAHDPRAGRDAEGDRAPDAEPARPHRERPVPVRVDGGVLVPARDQVVDARADDPEDHAPDGDAVDEIPVAAPAHPALPGEPDGGRDREQEHQPVHVDRERADAVDARRRRGNRCEDGAHGRPLSSKDMTDTIAIERTYPASAAEVWRLWTTKDGI